MEKYNPPTTSSIFESSETHHNFPLMMNTMNPHDHELDDDQYRRNNGFPSSSTAAAPAGEMDPNAAVFAGSENEAKPGKKKGEKKSKKPKYAFQTRSQVDILDDGYRWRKYGQKAVKNNKFPRSYYRCTHQGCNVKKQIQRLSKDEGIVVTTYEGVHSHAIHKTTDNFQHILSQMQIYTAPTY